jgi:cytochrome c556
MPHLRTAVTGLLLALSLALAPAGAAPQNPAEEAIAYRQSVYRVLEWNVRPLGAMVKGTAPYDPALFASRASRVAALTPMLLEGFAPGSYLKGKTSAREAIWSDRTTFEGLLQKLSLKSAALADAARANDLAAAKPAFNDLVQVCKDCHKQFRERDRD